MAGFSFKQLQDQAKEAGIGEPVPAGRYTVKAVETEAKTSSTGKEMIVVKFAIIEGPHANRKVFNNYVLVTDNNNALAFFFKHMAAFGLDQDFFASEPTMQQVAAAMRDKVVDVDIVIDTYQGEERNKVKNTYRSSSISDAGSSPAGAPRPPF